MDQILVRRAQEWRESQSQEDYDALADAVREIHGKNWMVLHFELVTAYIEIARLQERLQDAESRAA